MYVKYLNVAKINLMNYVNWQYKKILVYFYSFQIKQMICVNLLLKIMVYYYLGFQIKQKKFVN